MTRTTSIRMITLATGRRRVRSLLAVCYFPSFINIIGPFFLTLTGHINPLPVFSLPHNPLANYGHLQYCSLLLKSHPFASCHSFLPCIQEAHVVSHTMTPPKRHVILQAFLIFHSIDVYAKVIPSTVLLDKSWQVLAHNFQTIPSTSEEGRKVTTHIQKGTIKTTTRRRKRYTGMSVYAQ